jgi:hypothetical protein
MKKREEAQTGINVVEKVKRKIAIVGYAPSSRDLAPYGNKEWEIWGVNELYKLGKKVDVLFELHDYKFLRSKERNPQHLEWLRAANIPVFMLKHYEDIPQSIEFPIDEVVKVAEPYGDYFTNSISYMIAFAIMLGVDEIGIWGIDMATDEEYQHQRPSIEYFVGVAIGRGIKVYIPPQSDLLKTRYRYGYDDMEAVQYKLKVKARKEELTKRINECDANANQFIAQKLQLMGALDDVNYWDRCWVPPLDNSNEKEAVKNGNQTN